MRKVLLVGLLLITVGAWGQIVRQVLPVNNYYVNLAEESYLGSNIKDTMLQFFEYFEQFYDFKMQINLPREYINECYDILWKKRSYQDQYFKIKIYAGMYFFDFFHKQDGSIESYGIFIIINNKNEVEFEMHWLITPLGG